MRLTFACFLLLLAFDGFAQRFDSLTLDSILDGSRLIREEVALERPIIMKFEPQTEVHGVLVVGTLYKASAHVDEFGYDEHASFASLGQELYAELPIGATCVFFEERCYTLQYWDWGKMDQVGNSTTVCITDEMVDKMIEDGDAKMDGGVAVASRVLRTAREVNATVHVSFME